MKKQLIFIFVLALILVPMVSATDLGNFQKDENLTIVQMCDTCTYVTLNSVILPNGSTLLFNTNMIKSGQTFYYNFQNTSNLGTYIYNVCGDKDSSRNCEILTFEITSSGKEFDIKHSLLYIIILLISSGFFGLSFYGFIKLPFENNRNQNGDIFSINNLKYVKIILFFISYSLLAWIANLLIGLTNNFINTKIEFKFFEVVFKLLIVTMYPLLIAGVIFIVVLLAKDSKLNKLFKAGFTKR